NSASETSEPAGPSTTASRSTPGRAEAHPSHLEEPPECAISRSTSRPLSDSTTCSANSLTTYSSRTRATYWRTPQETASDSPTNRPTTNPVIDEVIVSGTDHRGDGHLELFGDVVEGLGVVFGTAHRHGALQCRDDQGRRGGRGTGGTRCQLPCPTQHQAT